MLTRTVHNSPKSCTFFDGLNIHLSKPQRQHVLNLADALLVCEDEKTLAALQRQFIQAPDASNMADFLRISLYGAKNLSIARNRSGRLPVIIVDDTSQDISSTDRSCCVTYWPGYRKVLT